MSDVLATRCLEVRQRRRSDQSDARSAAMQAWPLMTVIPRRSPLDRTQRARQGTGIALRGWRLCARLAC